MFTHFAYGFFFLEAFWLLFFWLRRVKDHQKFPRWLDWIPIARSYHWLYGQAALVLVAGILVSKLLKHASVARSSADVLFWLAGMGVCWLWNYRKWFYIVRWVKA